MSNLSKCSNLSKYLVAVGGEFSLRFRLEVEEDDAPEVEFMLELLPL